MSFERLWNYFKILIMILFEIFLEMFCDYASNSNTPMLGIYLWLLNHKLNWYGLVRQRVIWETIESYFLNTSCPAALHTLPFALHHFPLPCSRIEICSRQHYYDLSNRFKLPPMQTHHIFPLLSTPYALPVRPYSLAKQIRLIFHTICSPTNTRSHAERKRVREREGCGEFWMEKSRPFSSGTNKISP